MLSHKAEAATVEAGFMAAEAGFVAVGAGFVAVEAFTVRVVSEVFVAEVFVAEAGSQAFIGATLGAFTAGVSGGFTAIAVFSVPGSMGTRGIGIGVIPIIGVTRITPTILTTPIIPITRISQNYRSTLRYVVYTGDS
jgi:hypothetical protein